MDRNTNRLGSSDASQMDGQGWSDPLPGHCPEIPRGHQAVSKVSWTTTALTLSVLMGK